MSLFIVLLLTIACLAVVSAGTTAAESAFLRSVSSSGQSIQDIISAKVQGTLAMLPKEIKAQAVASNGIAPMASATVPSSYGYLTSCGNGEAAALPLGMCFSAGGGYYMMWGQTSPNGVNTISYSLYTDSACATTAITTVANFAGSCSTNGNQYNVGASSVTIPAVPSGAGVVQNFYTTSTCGSLVGWFFTPQGACVIDAPTYQTGVCTSTTVPVTTYGVGATVCSGSGTSTTLTLTTTCSYLPGTAYAASPYTGGDAAVMLGCTYYSNSCQNVATAAAAATCFAGSETVTLASGEVKSIADVTVGDSVLAYSNGKTVFSDVIATPHPRNNVAADFQHIVTEAGSDIKLTADHLILSGACSTELPLVRAANVQTGACVQTVTGQQVVVSNEVVQSEGLYTVVTENKADLVVVNGIVASPFAVNHAVGNAVYGIHRLAYAVAPALMASAAFKAVNAVASNLAAYFSK